MRVVVEEDFLKDIANNLRGHNANLSIISEIDGIIKDAEEHKEEINKLENQEIWIKCFYNGYFYKFIDMSLSVEIREENPNVKEDGFVGTTTLFPPLNEEEGKVDLTPLLFTLLHKMKDKPQGKFKCYATGFSRQMHFNKDLLSAPLPEGVLKLFGIEKKDAL